MLLSKSAQKIAKPLYYMRAFDLLQVSTYVPQKDDHYLPLDHKKGGKGTESIQDKPSTSLEEYNVLSIVRMIMPLLPWLVRIS